MSPEEYENYFNKQVNAITDLMHDVVMQGLIVHESVCSSPQPEVCRVFFADEIGKKVFQCIFDNMEQKLS